jgi:D-sedoheptulose 7-phosphate isomerase
MIKSIIKASIEAKQRILADDALLAEVEKVAELAAEAYRKGGKILVAGNGGSAADAQHFAAEYVGRFYYDRPALPAIALSTDTSILTAIGNDYGYDFVFSRQVEAHGQPGDLFFAISTSGNSPSIVKALESARAKGVTTVGLTGQKPCKMDALCDHIFKMPSADTPRIQEGHALIEHIICQMVEEKIFPKE